MTDRVVFLLDGGFVTKRLGKQLKRPPTAQDIDDLVKKILQDPNLSGKVLFRVFFYDSPPFQEKKTHPISRASVDYSKSATFKRNTAFFKDLDLTPNFAVRRGTLLWRGWKLTPKAVSNLLSSGARPLVQTDVVEDFEQKQVDIKLGLDIAWIALKGIAKSMVVVTGDSDLVPALKFARKEGVRVFLHTLGMGVGTREELRVHVDVVLG